MKHLILGIIVLFLASFTAAQAGTPCNGTDFSGTGCEITNVVPTGSLMCIKFLGGQCPAGKLPGFFGVFDKSGVPFHVVVDDDGAYYVTRADEADGQGDLVRIIPGGDPNTGYGGEIIGRGFNPEGLAFDPISKKFYTAHSRSSFRAVFSIPKAGADPPNFGATIFFGGGTTQLFSEGVAVNSSGTVFATAFNSGGAIFNATGRFFINSGFGSIPRGFIIDQSDNFIVVGVEGNTGEGYVVRIDPANPFGFFYFARQATVLGRPFIPTGNPAVTQDGKIIVTYSDRVLVLEAGATSGTEIASIIHEGFPLAGPRCRLAMSLEEKKS